MVLQIG